jgi:hypothetical protein
LKKDIVIPKAEAVYFAVVLDNNDIHNTKDWIAYIINDSEVTLEMILILSEGYSENHKTSQMRHKLDTLPPKSFAKIEMLQEEVLQLNNSFKLSYFENNKMFEKTFVFKKNTINEKAFQPLPLMSRRGILVK